jgi:hypothetical protein
MKTAIQALLRPTLSGVILVSALLLSSNAFADITGKPITLKSKPIKLTTSQLMQRAKLDKPAVYREPKRNEEESDRENLQNHPASPEVSSWPPPNTSLVNGASLGGGLFDGPLFSVQSIIGGSTISESGYVPPDSTGDVGPRDIIIAVNGRVRSYNRNGANGNLNIAANTMFAPVSGGSNINVVDPRVVYDRISQRWFIAQITTTLVAGDNIICLAVSDGPNIETSTVWSLFQIQQNIGSGPVGFADYETLAVDANAVYIGSNRFTQTSSGLSFANADMFVLRKSDLLTGTLTVTPFRNLIGGGAGMFTPWGCTNDDPTATTGLVVGVSSSGNGIIKARRITNPGGTPVLGTETSIIVPTTSSPPAMPISTSATTTGSVSALDNRLFYARIFKNRTTGVQTVWTAHGIGVNASGVATTISPRAAGRWYQFGNPFSGTINLVQSGTAYDNTATNPLFCTIPSVAMNGQGHAFVGFSMGNLANSPGIGGAYRLASDTLGSTRSPFLIQAGVNYYNAQSSVVNGKRWGDYSVTVLDPRDGMSIWTFQEHVSANNVWRTSAVKMRAPAPTISGVTPSTLTQGSSNINLVITGTGIFDPDPSYPDHLAVSIPTGFTINSVTWNSDTQAIVNVSVSATATTGARTLTLTNPDGQTATANLTVNPLIKNLAGNLTLQGYTGSVAGLEFTYELRDTTTNTILQTNTVTGLGTGNSFNLTTTLPNGSYKLRIKGTTRFLAKSQTVNIVGASTSGLSYTLTNGDVDGSNGVGAVDFNQLRAAWGTTTTGGADLNGDGIVGGLDFNIMRSSWGLFGDN